MKKKILNIIKQSSSGRHLVSSYVLLKHCLPKLGWNKSVKYRLPVDAENKELPWFTYSSIEFLKNRIHKEFSVFEYGSGNSTIWFSKKTKNIVSVEHDKEWYKHIENQLILHPNIAYKYKKLENEEYEKAILEDQQQFEIVVIDGKERIACGKNSILALKENGIIIWDDSERTEYQEAYDYLKEKGFKRLDLWGLAPIVAYFKCTTIFYKQNNCLNI